MSEFTNTNFFSQDTNLKISGDQPVTSYYALPKPNGSAPINYSVTYTPINTLFSSIGLELPEGLKEICVAGSLEKDCLMGFVSTKVVDNLTNWEFINEKATSLSLFDMDLQYHGEARVECSLALDIPITTCLVGRFFALNRFNFDEMHKFLIPRAAAYSAGLLKHFFRGKLKASNLGFPDVNLENSQYVFRTITVDLQNLTETIFDPFSASNTIFLESVSGGSIQQLMGGGYLTAVAYNTSTKKTTTSRPISITSSNTLKFNDTPSNFSFIFDESIPFDNIEKGAINLQIIYDGRIGIDRGIAVAKITPLTIETVAGTGVGGFSGDGGFAKNAQLYVPHGIALDSEGNLYISDYENDRIRKVFTNGTIITIAGSGQRGYSTGGGSALQASLNGPTGIAIGPEGAVYFIDSYNNTLRKVLNNTITNVTGLYGSGYVKTATGNPVYVRDGRLVFNGSTLYMTQSGMSTIYKIDGNLASIIAGNTAYNPWNPAPYPNNGASALQTTLGIPYGITWHNGALHFSDLLYNQVFKLDTCANGANCLYTVAGSGNSGLAGDNVAATQAWLKYPSGVASSPSGNLYIAVEDEHRVRSIGADGKITTIAGNGIAGSGGDGGSLPKQV